MNGVVMLLDGAPMYKASFHQLNGVVVLTSAVYVLASARAYPMKVMSIV
jgi:heme A synthase